MTIEKLRAFLDSNQIRYETTQHSKAYTAQEIAALAHIPGKELAKTVMVKIDGALAMAVLPASEQVDFELLAHALDANCVELASEQEFEPTFSDCEVGAMPPFGNLYGLDVYVAEHLTHDRWIAFNAGSHTELIRMRYQDFAWLVRPTVFEFSRVGAV